MARNTSKPTDWKEKSEAYRRWIEDHVRGELLDPVWTFSWIKCMSITRTSERPDSVFLTQKHLCQNDLYNHSRRVHRSVANVGEVGLGLLIGERQSGRLRLQSG